MAFECGLHYYAYWMDWLPYAALQNTYPWFWEQALGNAFGSLIVQGGLQVVYNLYLFYKA
jgi:hypothetical protein